MVPSKSTVVQNPYEFGRQAVTLMAKKLRGEDFKIPENKQVHCSDPGDRQEQRRRILGEPEETSRTLVNADIRCVLHCVVPDPILELKGIGKRFPGVVALSHVDLSVAPGEVVALIGENGAGKSTLMKILGGVYQADEGTIRVDGREVQIRHVADAQKLGVSLIHQELNNLDNLDIGGNIFLGREPLSGGFLRLVDRKKIAEKSRGYLEKVGLNLSPWTGLSFLSIAQQQLVEIAKALSTNARIIVMDEPTSCLTLTETNRLFKLIAELKSSGRERYLYFASSDGGE